MAITIVQSPENRASMHDDLWHVVTSNNTGQSGFKYVFDIYISTTLVARIKLFPDPNEDCGTFNAGNIIRNYWTTYFKPNTTQTAFSHSTDGIFVAYTIKFGEEYGGTLYTNLTEANYEAFNFYNPIFRDWSTSYLDTFNGKWLTGRDRSALTCGYTEKLFASWFNYGFPDVSQALKVTVDGGSEQTGTGNFTNAVQIFDVSPGAINAYFGSTIIPSTATQYRVRINSGDYLTIKLACNRYEVETLHFLNSLGGYDTMTFRLVNREERTATRESYQRPGWEVVSDTVARYDSFKKMYAGRVNHVISQGVTFRLTSDFLTETDHTWLRDLIMSPEVYLEKSGYYYPVTIGTNNWAERIRTVDKMFNLTLDVNYSRPVNSQFR
jgi:hypothetical protein